ncbi:MAG: AAA family ATPase [Candidatus Eisenbacteria bacterium]
MSLIKTACELDDTGKKPHYVSLVVHLRANGQLDQAGGLPYLDLLLQPQYCYPSLIDQHCSDVRKAYITNKANQALWKAQEELRHGADPSEVRQTLNASFEELPWAEHTSDGLDIKPISEILEMAPDIEWRVDGLIPTKTVGILSGESSSGKTWLILTLAIAVASGQRWLGIFYVKQAPVLIIDQEMGEDLLKQRFKALGAAGNLPIGITCFQDMSLETPEGKAKLVEAIRKHTPGLVLIDSLVGVFEGNENDASEVKPLTRGLVKIAREMGVNLILTHHARKEGKVSNRGGQRLRGSSELKAGPDWHICVRMDKNYVIAIEHEKGRAAREISKFYAELRDNPDGSVSLVGRECKLTKCQKAESVIRDEFTTPSAELSRQYLVDVCQNQHIGERTTDKVLLDMEGKGELVSVPGGNRKVYRLATSAESCISDDPQSANFARGANPKAPRRRQAGYS